LARKVIIIIGTAGFIGSSLVVVVSKDRNIIAINQRKPNPTLITAAPNVTSEKLNIANDIKII